MPSKYAQDIETIARTVPKIQEQIEGLATDVGEIKVQLLAADDRQRGDHDKITALETRLGIWAGVQATLTVLASAVAAWLGLQR